MNAEQSACASSGKTEAWGQLDWSPCERQVRRLQARIVKATREGRHGKAKALQWLLTHSFAAKALAVKRVTENQGKALALGQTQTFRQTASMGEKAIFSPH
jgi:RNA-directed DNA polymerase